MKIRFTAAERMVLEWDGLLWTCRAAPAAAAALNGAVLPEGPDILQRAMQLLAASGWTGCRTKVLDDTGWPEDGVAPGGATGDDRGHDGSAEAADEGGPPAHPPGDGGGGLCAGRADAGDAGEHLAQIIRRLSAFRTRCADEWEQPELERQELIRAAVDWGLVLDVPGPLMESSREHGKRFDEQNQLWWKFTKPGLSGYDVSWTDQGTPFLHNALPLDYFLRLDRQNRLFGDEILFRGLWMDGESGWRIVTTQPHVSGPPATMEDIGAGMTAQGFHRLRWDGIGYESAQAWRTGRLCVWDLHPGNVVRHGSLIVPVDVIITPLPEGWPPSHFHP